MGYTLDLAAPVVSYVPTETRFEPSEVVRRSKVKVSANVVMWVHEQPYGSLEADSLEDWDVSDADIDLLQAYANLLAAAIEKHDLMARIERLANERQILLNEIFHRIKNLLTNVSAIARRTVKHSHTLEEFQDAFDGRINALSRAHDLLLAAPDRPVPLRELLALEFDAKGLSEGTLVQLMGPDVLCDPRTIQTLALVSSNSLLTPSNTELSRRRHPQARVYAFIGASRSRRSTKRSS
jgi:two-component sensor histidine kinase